MSAPTLSDLLAVVRVDDNMSQDLARIVCMDIAQKYPKKEEDLLGAVDELVLGDERSPFWSTFLTRDRTALYKLCNRALDRVRIRNSRQRKRESIALNGPVQASAAAPGPLEELAWADEVEHLERDAWTWFATLKKPKERAAVALMIEHYDPSHPRAATHYSDRDVNVATGLSRPRIAELRAELIRLADLWITSDPPEQTPTHYTEDATKLNGTETALPTFIPGPEYSSDDEQSGSSADSLSGPGSALGEEYYRLDTLLLQAARRHATPEELKEVRNAAAAVDQRAGTTETSKRKVRVRVDKKGYAELMRLQEERIQRRRLDALLCSTLPKEAA